MNQSSNSLSTTLEEMVDILTEVGNLPISIFHRITFCSILRAGLSFHPAKKQHRAELSKLVQTIPSSYRGLTTGKLYLKSLKFLKEYEKIIRNKYRAVLLKEANLQHIQDFLRKNLGKVDKVAVLDCASIPEIVTFAAKFKLLNRYPIILTEIFINPIGITQFLTQQLKMFNQKTALSGYAQFLKQTLNAKQCYKTPLIDLTVHKHGFSPKEFLSSLNMEALFKTIKDLAGLDSILITHDHGYDVAVNDYGLYITHGYKGECPINFSKIALFLAVS